MRGGLFCYPLISSNACASVNPAFFSSEYQPKSCFASFSCSSCLPSPIVGRNIEGGGNVLHHVHRVRALLLFVFLFLFAGGLRLHFGKNALRLFTFPENGLVQPSARAFPIISPNDACARSLRLRHKIPKYQISERKADARPRCRCTRSSCSTPPK